MEFHFFGSGTCNEDRMEPYPLVEVVPAPIPRVAMSPAVGSPAYLRSYIPEESQRSGFQLNFALDFRA